MPELIRDDGNQTYESCTIMLRALRAVIAANVIGDVVEIGCNVGMTSIMFGELLKESAPDKTLHLYDSFEGMSGIAPQDIGTPILPGELKTDPEVVIDRFVKADCPWPVIHKGWVADTLPNDLPERICYALIDVDLYEPITHALKCVYPRLSPGAVCIVDDAINGHFPGAHLAMREFMESHNHKYMRFGSHQLGFFNIPATLEIEEWSQTSST